MYICIYIYYCFPLIYSIYILHTDIDTYMYIIIGGFNIHIYIIPYIHGLELIFTDWTDTEDIIYLYLCYGSPESGGNFYKRTGRKRPRGCRRFVLLSNSLENYVLDIF